MKFRHLLPGVVAAGALIASNAASAALITEWNWTGTLTEWQTATQGALTPITDGGPPNPSLGTVTHGPGDGDTTFSVVNTTFPDLTGVSLTENENGPIDIYDVGLGFGQVGPQIGGSITYEINTTDPLGLNMAALDTVKASDPTTVTKELFNVNPETNPAATPFLTLTSKNGVPNPSSGYTQWQPHYQHIWVVDTIDPASTGGVNDIHNQFSVPDPGTLSLLGIGMVGLGARRRMTKKAKA